MDAIIKIIDYGKKPDSVTLVFPKTSQPELIELYHDFCETTYTTITSGFKPEEIDKLPLNLRRQIFNQLYTEPVHFFDALPDDKSSDKNYLSSMIFPTGYSANAAESLENITTQFYDYLGQHKIIFAQHLAVAIDGKPEHNLVKREIINEYTSVLL